MKLILNLLKLQQKKWKLKLTPGVFNLKYLTFDLAKYQK